MVDSDWMTSRPQARHHVEESEIKLELADQFQSFMRLSGYLEVLMGREAHVYELMPDNFRHAWSEAFAAALHAVTNDNGRKVIDLAEEVCQRFTFALQIMDAPAWPDRLERDRIYWETLVR